MSRCDGLISHEKVLLHLKTGSVSSNDDGVGWPAS